MTNTEFRTFVDNWLNGNREDVKAVLVALSPLQAAAVVLRFSEHMRSLGAVSFPYEVSSFRNWLEAIS